MTNSGMRMKYCSSGPKSALPGTCMAETTAGAGFFLGACSRLVPSPWKDKLQNCEKNVSGKIQVQASCCERLVTLVGFNPNKNALSINSKGTVPEVKSLQSLQSSSFKRLAWLYSAHRLGWIWLSNWAHIAELLRTEARKMLVSERLRSFPSSYFLTVYAPEAF